MTQRAKIEPLIRRTLDSSVVEIETVDIDVDFGHCIQALTDIIRSNTILVNFQLTQLHPPAFFGIRVRGQPQGWPQSFYAAFSSFLFPNNSTISLIDQTWSATN